MWGRGRGGCDVRKGRHWAFKSSVLSGGGGWKSRGREEPHCYPGRMRGPGLVTKGLGLFTLDLRALVGNVYRREPFMKWQQVHIKTHLVPGLG